MHDHDRGLSHDLPMILERSLGRRGLMALFGGVGAVAVTGCAGEEKTGTDAASRQAVTDGEIPEETAGPFPADGSNGVDVLSESGVVRQDITASFGAGSATAQGVSLRLRLRVYDLQGEDISVLAGAAIYVWHCDREGRYSMYSSGVEGENYLRGVQVADPKGWVEFTTVFPGAYPGRWPHVHFEVYPSLDDATRASGKLRTSQLALPEEASREAYGAAGYDASAAHLSETPLEKDIVFADGHSLQMATTTGDNEQGWVASLNVPV
jgi:protocatechuate 3,4-dioxygenase beta subunit